MALEAIGGAALGAAFSELLKLVKGLTKQTVEFKTLLARFEKTLEQIEPAFAKITELNNRPAEDRTMLGSLLVDGKKLIVKCSMIKSWNVITTNKYTKKLVDLDNKLLRFFHIEATKGMLTALVASSGQGRSFRPCVVPGLPEFTIGLDQHVAELKRMLLKDDTQLLVISAPGGFGKTTLAKKLCHDDEIKDIFGDNILYVTVSPETSLKSIALSLFKHYDINNYELKSEEDAKNQIENLVKQKGSGKMLLLLDDVWSESIIWDLKFQIPGYKALVTSRYSFREFNSTYNLGLLNDEDSKTLFCHHAFPSGQINPVNDVPDDLIDEMVKVCNGLPLALTVVAASLCRQPVFKWRYTLKKWSDGQSILESHEKLLVCLQTSIDALDDELHNGLLVHHYAKECFLDFGLFPEDVQIASTALMDMWVELYDFDDEDMDAVINLHHLSSRNLINLVEIRKAASEMKDYCRQYHVTQHDVLRELAIYLSKQEPTARRKRLFTEIHSNNFPEWWTQDPVNARILSISTDGEFNSTWDDLNAPNVEVLILNIRSEHYTLPDFIKKMSQLKVLIVTGYGGYPTQLNNLQVLASLSKLSRIRFEHVSVSPSIQVIFTLKTLKKLTFVMCKIGEALNSNTTGSAYTLENLKEFEIDLCYDLKQLPARLCGSSHLKKLIITNCQELDVLPKELGNLSSLEILVLHCCTKLKELPESIGSLHKLNIIDISDCSHISVLPKQIGELSNLRTIDISRCEGLEKFPKSLAELKQLKVVICDEERSYLWKDIASDHSQVKMSFVEEDRIENLKKICR